MSTLGSPRTGAALVLVGLLVLAASPAAQAMGKNGGGVLNVHFDPDIVYVGEVPAGVYFAQFAEACTDIPVDECEMAYNYPCHYGEDLVPDLEEPPFPSVNYIMWVCAVFPDSTCVELSRIEFGLDQFEGVINIVDWGTLADDGMTTPGWPGPGESIDMEWDEPLTAHVVPLLYLVGQPLPNAKTPLMGGEWSNQVIFYDQAGNPTQGGGATGDDYPIGNWLRPEMDGYNPGWGGQTFMHVCCFADGSCAIMIEEECLAQGGQWDGGLTSCDPNPCAQPEVCCFEDGSCLMLPEWSCTDLGGASHPEWETCDPNQCPQPEAACCFSDGTCEVMLEEDCTLADGVFHAEWDSCDPNNCPQPVVCCFDNGSCQVLVEADCTAAGGTSRPDLGNSCDPNLCPQPLYVCCMGDGTCQVLTTDDCVAADGDSRPDLGSSCDPNPCPAVRVCCFGNGGCSLLTHQECTDGEGVWLNTVNTCEGNPCKLRSCCVELTCQIVRYDECLTLQGDWLADKDWCDPNPCEPGTQAPSTSWGRIKTLYQSK